MLKDRFGRTVDYLRLSVTDRCDFRCIYCMAEEMAFLPRAEILSLEELQRVARVFVELGVRRIRLTGGEPLVRPGLARLAGWLSAIPGLDELNLTTNGARLPAQAADLKAAGLSRINISLDSLDAGRFRALTRTGNLDDVLAGIEAARAEAFSRIKLNTVVLRGRNDDELEDLLQFALARDLDISFIEEMPLGQMDTRDRGEAFMSSQSIRERLADTVQLVPAATSSAGPSRYWQVPGHQSRIGFISPHSENFCASCNRVRLTVEGRLLLCLGNEHSVDLKTVMRANPDDDAPLASAIVDAMAIKPERHHFSHEPEEQLVRFMNMTGG
ncbi:MAG: GTP 3',8-cyclase MoaA [Alcanivoracaceae bacterium]|jgi:cyclic pyranopterin phosphate synthase|nr:GTP 3',8-cyclase MoaA [Alcanivoracaceae bacterium]